MTKLGLAFLAFFAISALAQTPELATQCGKLSRVDRGNYRAYFLIGDNGTTIRIMQFEPLELETKAIELDGQHACVTGVSRVGNSFFPVISIEQGKN